MERKSRNQILKEVKERLTTGNYSEIHKLRSINTTDKIVILGNKRLNEKDIYDYYEKIIDMQQNDENEFKAIGILVDNNVFLNMNETEKQRYILDLSKLYLSLRQEILLK